MATCRLSKKVRITLRGLIILGLFTVLPVDANGVDYVAPGSRGVADTPPISADWVARAIKLRYVMFDDPNVAKMAQDVTRTAAPEQDSWSQRTFAEIRTAFASDDVLSKNASSDVRCSREGCLAALDSSFPDVHRLLNLYRARLLTYLTPRLALPSHDNVMLVHVHDHRYVIFAIFADYRSGDATKAPEILSNPIADDVHKGQEALKDGRWADALRYATAADANAGLSSFDIETLSELKGYAYSQLNNYRRAQEAYQTALTSALEISMNNIWEITRHILILSSINHLDFKAIEAGRNLAQNNLAQGKDLAILAKSYFLLGDCRYATKWAASAANLGEMPGDFSAQLVTECGQRSYRLPND